MNWPDILGLIPGYDPFAHADGCVFDERAADVAVKFIQQLKHIEGSVAGTPFVLEPWQQAVIGNLFGWRRKDAQGRRVRRYRESLLYVPRKNGKTPIAAAIGLYVLFADQEVGQQNYIAAGAREQAAFLFRHAKGMVNDSPVLAGASRVYGGHAEAGQSRSIVIEGKHSFLRVVSADGDKIHGGNTHLAIIDELHTQNDRNLVDVFQTSTASLNRASPLCIWITTADFDRPSICNEKYDYACKVRDGVINDPQFLPVIYEATDKDDWTAPETWRKANPNLGVSVSEEYLERECQRAKDSPGYQNTFKRLHLNIRTGQDVLWIDLGKWRACGRDIDWSEYAGRPCWGGLDLASTTDMTAFVLAFREDDGYSLRSWFWMPEGRMQTRREHSILYQLRQWASDGWITLTPGDTTDYDFVTDRIVKLASEYDVQDVGFDPWNALQTATHLKERHGVEMVEFRQGFISMNEPAKELERLVVAGKVSHDNNPVLTWMVSNARVKTDPSGNIRPVKPDHQSEAKVDGVVASVMAIGRAMTSDGASWYKYGALTK